MLTGHIILTCTIVERAEIVVSLSVLSVMVDGSLQGQNRLKTVGEAVVAASLGSKVKAFFLSGEPHIIIGHRRCGSIVISKLPDVSGHFVLSTAPVVECKLVVVVKLFVHQVDEIVKHSLVASKQILLIAATIVEEVELLAFLADAQRLVLASGEPKHRSFQCQHLMVAAVASQTAVDFLQGIFEPAFLYRDAGSLIEGSTPPGIAPRCFPEPFVCLVQHTLIAQRQGEVVERLTVVGIRIALIENFLGMAQIGFCFTEATTAQIPQPHLVEATIIVGVAAQGFLIIVSRIQCGMTILLQMQTCEIELVVGLGVLRRQCCLSGIGNRTDLVGFSMPLKVVGIECQRS